MTPFIVKKTLEIAKKTGNDVIVQVKGNQKILLQDCQKVCETENPDDTYTEPISKARGRIEQCKAEIYLSPTFTNKGWGLAKVVVKISRDIQVFDTKEKSWKKRNEKSYYISTLDLSAHIFAKLRSFALNILRKNDVENVSNELYKNSLKLEHVLNYDGIA